jgi:hypothetical protein
MIRDPNIPTTAELYGDAVAAGASTRDVIGAAGFAGRNAVIGALLWRALHGGDRTVVAKLRGHLYDVARAMATRNHWNHREVAALKPLTAKVLSWYLADTCRTCNGRKYRRIPGTPMLSATSCQTCRGIGRQSIDRAFPETSQRCARQLATYLDTAESEMATKVRRAQVLRGD